MFTCTGHLLLPQPLFALPLPSRQGRDNSQIKHGRKRLCLTAEGQAGAESCYPGFVPQVLTMFPCFHHSRVQMTVTGILQRRVREDHEEPFVGWDQLQSSLSVDTALRKVGNVTWSASLFKLRNIYEETFAHSDCSLLGKCC